MPDVIEGQSVSLGAAQRLLEAGREQAVAMGLPVNLAVADAQGFLVAHVRMDGAPLPSIEHAINKAFTSAQFGKPTVELKIDAEPGGELFGLNLTLGRRVVVFGGGLPLRRAGKVVGAVGVSGGTSAQDQEIAAVMVSAFENK